MICPNCGQHIVPIPEHLCRSCVFYKPPAPGTIGAGQSKGRCMWRLPAFLVVPFWIGRASNSVGKNKGRDCAAYRQKEPLS